MKDQPQLKGSNRFRWEVYVWPSRLRVQLRDMWLNVFLQKTADPDSAPRRASSQNLNRPRKHYIHIHFCTLRRRTILQFRGSFLFPSSMTYSQSWYAEQPVHGQVRQRTIQIEKDRIGFPPFCAVGSELSVQMVQGSLTLSARAICCLSSIYLIHHLPYASITMDQHSSLSQNRL